MNTEKLYQAIRSGICAGFVIRDGRVITAAPILRKWIGLVDEKSAFERLRGFKVTFVSAIQSA